MSPAHNFKVKTCGALPAINQLKLLTPVNIRTYPKPSTSCAGNVFAGNAITSSYQSKSRKRSGNNTI